MKFLNEGYIIDWNIEQITGYKPITTYYTDFSIADKFGTKAVQDTFNRGFKLAKTDYKYLTEFVMALNWKIFQHYENNDELARLYNNLWEQADEYAMENLKGDELSYFIRTTD